MHVVQVVTEPKDGDVVVYRERGVHSGSCRIGTFGVEGHESAPTLAEALRRGKRLAADRRTDVWVSCRARWTDTAAPTFRRVAAHREPAVEMLVV